MAFIDGLDRWEPSEDFPGAGQPPQLAHGLLNRPGCGWRVGVVGLDDDGAARPCLTIDLAGY